MEWLHGTASIRPASVSAEPSGAVKRLSAFSPRCTVAAPFANAVVSLPCSPEIDPHRAARSPRSIRGRCLLPRLERRMRLERRGWMMRLQCVTGGSRVAALRG